MNALFVPSSLIADFVVKVNVKDICENFSIKRSTNVKAKIIEMVDSSSFLEQTLF